MGVTGVGKSQFIAHLAKTAVVGDGVKSCKPILFLPFPVQVGAED